MKKVNLDAPQVKTESTPTTHLKTKHIPIATLKSSQLRTRHWNQDMFDPPHWNQVNFYNLHKKVNFDDFNKTKQFRPEQNNFAPYLNHVNFDLPHKHQLGFNLNNEFKSFSIPTLYLSQFVCPTQLPCQFRPSPKTKNVSIPTLNSTPSWIPRAELRLMPTQNQSPFDPELQS